MDADTECAFWAGLANMSREPTPYCLMICERPCEYRKACDCIKMACYNDVNRVRKMAEQTLEQMRRDAQPSLL